MAKKILIIAPSWVGDLVMSQTLFRVLKQQHSNCVIDVLAPNWCKAVLSRMPEVASAIAMPIGHGKLQLWQRYKIASKLKKHNYDQAIILPNSLKSALIPFFARIRKRTGFVGEMRYGLINDIYKLDKQQLPLMVQRFAALAYKNFKDLPENLQQVWPLLKPHKVSISYDNSKKILSLCPGAAFGPAKMWPLKHFAAVANKKLQEGWQVWIFGSKNDVDLADKINQYTNNNCVSYAGKVDLAEAIDLLALSSHVVTNDSGLMHIASALGLPLTALYGATSSDFTPPLSKTAKILNLNLSCSPCFKRTCPLLHHNCMEQILPDQVCEF